ncbi:MAG: hypothetical protein JWL71_3509 [Acidobacteria bacterium]|nr:hypothetical protein [Acidobacteriota bacterium]
MFAGRIDEIRKLEQGLFQTKNGNPQHFLITGERGIGKSSLFLNLDWVARGVIAPLGGEASSNFLVASIVLEPSTDYAGLIGKVGAALRQAVAAQKPATEVCKALWDFAARWEIAGVKYRAAPSVIDPHEMLDDLVLAVKNAFDDIKLYFEGILILIDEADKPPHTAHLGEFVKLFTERLTRQGCDAVCIGLAGLPAVLDRLAQSHESSPRVFEVLTLEPLSPQERKWVVERALATAAEKNDFVTRIEDDALDWLSSMSEGYPHFIQQFGYCAFDVDVDNNIDMFDVFKGAFNENGAFHQLGIKYFRDLYFEQINSEEYREVLRVMSTAMDGWVTKAHIRKETGLKETTLGNAIAALKSRNIIVAQEGKKGVYRLPNKSFAIWIGWITAAKAASGPPSPQAGE